MDPTQGGPPEGVAQLSRVWMAQGDEITCATLDAPDAPYLNQYQFEIIPLGQLGAPGRAAKAEKFVERYGYGRKFVPWLRAHARSFDAIVVHGLWRYATLGARRAFVATNIPYVVFAHGMLDPWFKKAYPRKHRAKAVMWRLSEGPLLAHAARVLFTTEEEKRLAAESFTPYRVRPAVVGFGSSDISGDPVAQQRAFRAAHPALRDRPFLLYLSRIHPKKGVDLLIEAFSRHAASLPDLDLVIAGPSAPDYRAKLEARVAELGIGSRVHWTGMISDDIKWGAFHAAEAFILPSHSENFGVVVAEALACGKPVLISNKVNLWHEVADGGAGFVEPDTLQGTNRLIDRFLALSPTDYAAMKADARVCYEQNFRFETAAARVKALLVEAAMPQRAI